MFASARLPFGLRLRLTIFERRYKKIMGNRKFGWHSGVLHCKDAKIEGDLYVQDDIVFSDVSAGTLGVTGGIDLTPTTSAIGIDLGGTFSTSAINIDGTCSNRAIRIGTKTTGLKISSGLAVDAEPANNYLFGLFSVVSATEATSTDELRSAWIRTRVNNACPVGSNAGWGYGVCGAEIQLKIYGADMYSWQNSGVWAQLETQGATTNFKNGSYSQAVLANVGLTATTVIDSGATVSGVRIHSGSAVTNVTVNGMFAGLIVSKDNAASRSFNPGIYIQKGSCDTCIQLGTYAAEAYGSGIDATSWTHYGGEANPASAIKIFADTGNTDIYGDNATLWVRNLLDNDQGVSGTWSAGRFHQHLSDGVDINAGFWNCVRGYIEADGPTAMNIANATTHLIGVEGYIGLGMQCTIGAAGRLACLKAMIANEGSASFAGAGIACGLLIGTSGVTMPVGIYFDSIGAYATGIKMAGTVATGVDFSGTFTTAAISLDNATLGAGVHDIELRNTVTGDKTVICAGPAASDGDIVTAVGADADIADGSLYLSCVDGAGTLYIKKNDVWTAFTNP
jgi:hypothetical protein